MKELPFLDESVVADPSVVIHCTLKSDSTFTSGENDGSRHKGILGRKRH